MTAPTAKSRASGLRFGQIFGYGVGDFAFNLTFTFCSLFLLYFYTDVLGLSATTGGLIIMAALVWEGITDPLVGMLANRTKSRWGRYRPYLLLGAVPLALSFALMFVPTGLSGSALAMLALATHLLFRTVYTFVNIPYIALSAQMTSDSMERSRLAGARMIFAIICGLLLAAVSLPLARVLGDGVSGFFALSLLYGGVVIGILLLCFKTTRENIQFATDEHPTLGQMVRAVRYNRPFLILLAATLLGSVGYTMSGKALVYYLKYHVGSEAAVTTGLIVGLATAALAMPFWLMFMRQTSKRVTWLTGFALTGASALVMFALAPKAGALLWSLIAVAGAGNAAFILTFWSMAPDTVEYGQLTTGTRAEGAIFGFIIFSQKVALGIGTGMLGVILDQIGYRANQAQTAQTLDGILAMYTLAPFTLGALAAGCIWFYPLNRTAHASIVEQIAERQLSSSKPSSNLEVAS